MKYCSNRKRQWKDKLASLQKQFKTVVKETDGGDVKSLRKDLTLMSETVASLYETIEFLKEKAENFDAKAYFENGGLNFKVNATFSK